MNNWRDEVLKKFQNQSNKIILVHDTDFLLDDESLLNDLKEHGFAVERFDDSISFRYIYEQKYRLQEEYCKLIIYTNQQLIFPYEFLRKSVSLSVNIRNIFPRFSAQILRSMNHADLDALFTVHAQYQGSSSDIGTLEYIIKYMYKIPYEIIDNEVELYKLLLSLHYRGVELPIIVQKFLIKKFKQILALENLPIEKLISSSNFFYNFLEKQWASLVDGYIEVKCKKNEIPEESDYYKSNPLTHPDVRRLMSNLFTEGILSKVQGILSEQIPDWMKMGIEKINMSEDLHKKILNTSKEITIMLDDAKWYKDWIKIIDLISELKCTTLEVNEIQYSKDVDYLMTKVNKRFEEWMLNQFHTLVSLPPFPKPKMVHHIPHTIYARKKENEKVALLVLDGMGFIQWKQIKKYLKENNFSFEENSVFSWVPTITSVSRQAIFSGNIPMTFGRTIKTTASEEKYWKAFWESRGILKQYISYQKGLGKETYNPDNIYALKRDYVKVSGVVIDVIDQFIHHAVLGEKSLVSNLNIWLQTQYLVRLLNDLMDEQYTIYITSDHGNTKARGIGRVSEGVLVDQKGERVRVYADKTFLKDSASKIDSIPWNSVGLPENYYVLLSQYGQAFIPKGFENLTHGGISIEEVIVPFIKVQRK
ncbi:BREX-3 system phosphatase PglZ [Priestia megaterium]|uniref:BREX-3 system phosphatase PglZ n=1 Tax=Priestia megaterium TaxID=1404 RepID=UPI00234EC75C|nr:BREX-3 system phosphatase PglZ [Priestia megaterium]MDC7724452.1 BREX-3 system phosphatase PglZ [Priestia megaterium]